MIAFYVFVSPHKAFLTFSFSVCSWACSFFILWLCSLFLYHNTAIDLLGLALPVVGPVVTWLSAVTVPGRRRVHSFSSRPPGASPLTSAVRYPRGPSSPAFLQATLRISFNNTGELGYDGPLYDRFLHMTDDMLGYDIYTKKTQHIIWGM